MSTRQKNELIKGLLWLYGILFGFAFLASFDELVRRLS
jgi:hypothetical protein